MLSRSGDLPRATTDSAAEPVLVREEVLSEFAFLASVEHALCIEYLLIHCALGHDLPPADAGDAAQRVRAAATAASALAQDEMRHLHGVNQALAAAGKPPQLARATSITRDAISEITLVPPSPAAEEHFLDRAHAVAVAVDELYTRLRPSMTAQPALFEGIALEQLRMALEAGVDHAASLATLGEHLEGVSPAAYLRANRHEGGDEIERRLLGLSDSYYASIAATLQAWFADEDLLGGVLRGRAVSLMDGLNEINGLLVERGLLPRFTRVDGAPVGA